MLETEYTSVVGHIRLYDSGSYKDRSPYVCIVTVLHLSATEAYICGAHGKLDFGAVVKELERQGVKTFWYERNGRFRQKFIGDS